MSTTTAGTRLAWQQAIDRHTESIVNAADKTLPDERVTQLGKARMGKAQFSTFLGVTLETESPAAIINWIRYQMGRRDGSQTWGAGLGDDVIQHINEMKEWAREVAGDAHQNPHPRQVQLAHVALIRLYAGYLTRWYVARGGE